MPSFRCGVVILVSLVAAVVNGWAQDPASRPPDYDYFDQGMRRGSQTAGAVEAAALSSVRPARDSGGGARSPAVTIAGSADPEAIARNHLARQPGSLGQRALSAFDLPLQARYESKTAGFTHLVFQQRYAGVPYFQGQVQVHLDAVGRIVRVHQKPLPPSPNDLAASLGPQQALEAALLLLAPGSGSDLDVIAQETGAERRAEMIGSALRSPAPMSLVWFPLDGAAVAAWQAHIDLGSQRTYAVVIDASSGAILFSQNLARDADPRGTVFAAPAQAHPNKGGQSSEPLTGWPGSAGDCPADIYPASFRSGALMNRCWVSGTETLGNNADACLDLAGGNACEARAVSSSLQFDFPFANAYALTGNPAPDRAAALTNAFYWANVAHDWLYRLGFDESAGNFQADNFGRGGLGLDPVLIDVNDGALVNAASFTTPADGLSPRMQLGLYASLRRDSAFDGDVILHEYIHGLTARLVGGPGDTNGLPLWQSGALAEGWSDAYAASFTDDPVIGEYVTHNSASGLRTVAYDQSPYTFGRLGTLFLKVVPGTGGLNVAMPQVHRDGEIWASVLWDVRELLGRADFEALMTSALMLTPARPSMLDARDTVLQAAQAMSLGGPGGCDLWSIFATRGFGASAALNPIEPGQENDTGLSVFEASDVPTICGGAPPVLEILFEDDVESGTGAWTKSGLWHRTTRRAASGLHSWWFGQEGSGTYDTGARAPGSGLTITDGSGNAHHGATTSFGTIAVPGVTGNARLLNGYSDSIEVPISGGLTPPSFTVRTWVKLQAYPAGHFGMIAASYGGNYQGWFLAVNGQGKTVFLGAKAPSVARWLVSSTTLALERWYALSVTYHRPTGIAALYLDGSLEAQVSLPGLELETSRLLTFGRSSWHNGYYLNFAIDETQIYPVARTPSQVAADFAAFSPPAAVPNPAIVSEWGFDNQAEDLSGNGHHGSLQGTQTVTGVLGSGRRLNGFTDAIHFGASHRLTPSRSTMRAWVRLSSYPSNFGIIAANYNGNYQGWFVAVDSGGRLVVSQSRKPTSARWTVTNTTLALGRWYHLTVVFDGGMQRVSIYLDGTLDREDLLLGLTPQESGLFAVGKSSWHNGYYLAFDIDELRLVPRAFSAGEVQSDFASFPAP